MTEYPRTQDVSFRKKQDQHYIVEELYFFQNLLVIGKYTIKRTKENSIIFDIHMLQAFFVKSVKLTNTKTINFPKRNSQYLFVTKI